LLPMTASPVTPMSAFMLEDRNSDRRRRITCRRVLGPSIRR
jgi:hypothetical protein